MLISMGQVSQQYRLPVQKIESVLNITDEVIRFLIVRPDLKAIAKAEAEKAKKAEQAAKRGEREEKDEPIPRNAEVLVDHLYTAVPHCGKGLDKAEKLVEQDTATDRAD